MNGIKEELKNDLTSLKETVDQQYEVIKCLNETVKTLAEEFEEHKDELADTQASIQSIIDTNTDQLMQLCVKMDTLQEELHSIDKRITNNITQVNTTLSSELTSYNTKLDLMNKLFSDDFNDVKTELNVIDDTSNEIVDEIEDHDKQTGTKLMDIGSLICDSHDVDCCGSASRGWRRVVYLNMTDPNTNCPSGWSMTNYNIRTCGRASDGSNTCDSVFFPVIGGEYSQVCGKMKVYQWVWTPGFLGYNRGYSTVNDSYFSGVAVLHGSPRQHIWSFVAGTAEHFTSHYQGLCPCDTSYNILSIPSFVGDDYFCESGYIWPGFFNSLELYSFHSDDPLWDGDGCHSSSTCCTFNNPPYFTKYLDNPTTDDIELRLCCHFPLYRENVAVGLVEIYVR